MSHRKSIPVQNLLYFNNFLEFPYFFRGYKFKYIYFYNQILMFFIYTFFVKIYGFSINMLHIDYFKKNINIYIDFLNVSYRLRVGTVYNKKKFIMYRRHFLLSIFKYSGGILHKWLDRFVYMMLLFHKSSSLKAYYNFVNCVCMYSRHSSVVHALCNAYVSSSLVFDNSICCIFYLLFNFVFMHGCFNFGFFIYWFYCFFVYIFSLIYKSYIVFKPMHYKKIYKSSPVDNYNYFYKSVVTPHLDLLDFIYMYNTFYINISRNSSFLLYYMKYFFIFLFYNFIFCNKCWNFCFFFFNYFKCICYCWPSLKLYNVIRSSGWLLSYSEKLLKHNINYYYLTCSWDVPRFFGKGNMVRLFNYYAMKAYTYFKFDFVSIVFIFSTFFTSVHAVFNYSMINSKLIFLKYKALWHTFGMITLLSYTYGSGLYNVVNVDELSLLSSTMLYRRLRWYRFKSKLHRVSAYIRTFRTAYVRLCQECMFRRFNYVGFFFKKFFNLNTHAAYFFKKYGCVFLNKKNFYFIFYFIYKVELIFQLLIQCGCKDLFFYYLIFFLKNWYFFNNFFFKFLYCTKNARKKKKSLYSFNFFFFSRKFFIYFCKYFGKRLKNILFFFSKKKLKYLYSFSIAGFFGYRWYNVDKLSVFDNIKYSQVTWKHIKHYHIYAVRNNITTLCRATVSFSVINKCVLLWSNIPRNFANFIVQSLNFGNILINLVNAIICNQVRAQFFDSADALFRQSLLLVSNLRFQINCNFSELYVYSFLLDFNLKFLKGLSLLFCFFHFNVDFFFKFYINICFMNFIYFCEFFYFIFSINLLFNFYFLKLHLSDYRFCGFLGLYLLMYKFSKDYINITGAYILNYIYDIFFNVFITNRYRSIKYILRTLSNLFTDFLDLQKFCGFNFKIKGRMSKRTQRKQCFVINRGVLKLTENRGNLYSGKRALNTHIGSVSIYLYINMKVC